MANTWAQTLHYWDVYSFLGLLESWKINQIICTNFHQLHSEVYTYRWGLMPGHCICHFIYAYRDSRQIHWQIHNIHNATHLHDPTISFSYHNFPIFFISSQQIPTCSSYFLTKANIFFLSSQNLWNILGFCIVTYIYMIYLYRISHCDVFIIIIMVSSHFTKNLLTRIYPKYHNFFLRHYKSEIPANLCSIL